MCRLLDAPLTKTSTSCLAAIFPAVLFTVGRRHLEDVDCIARNRCSSIELQLLQQSVADPETGSACSVHYYDVTLNDVIVNSLTDTSLAGRGPCKSRVVVSSSYDVSYVRRNVVTVAPSSSWPETCTLYPVNKTRMRNLIL